MALRSQLRAARPDFDLREGDRVFYDIVYDLLVGNKGWFFNNDLDVLYQHDSGLTAGVRWTMAHAFYDRAAHYEPDAIFTAELRKGLPDFRRALHRAGPLVAYTWKKPDGAGFEGTLLVVLNWWLASPYRTGQDVSQLMPYMVLGYAITGDLLPPG